MLPNNIKTHKLRTFCIQSILLCVLSLSYLSVHAQADDENIPVLGIQFRPIIPSDLFSNKQFNYKVNEVDFSIQPKPGFSLGAVMRFGINKQFSFETGIHYTKRVYGLIISEDYFETEGKFRFTTYEVPLLGLIYIRLSEHAYINTAFGISLDFYPNNIKTGNEYYSQIGVRRNWVLPGLMANVGAEYRTPKHGIFYVGGSYHRNLWSMGATKISYKRYAVHEDLITELSGNYFALDFKYFFPTTRTDRPDYFGN